MSRRARDWAWRCRGLTPAERLVLLALAELADDHGGQCFPSLGQLARTTELSRRGVTKALAGLDGRLVDRERGGPRRSTGYRLLLPVRASPGWRAGNSIPHQRVGNRMPHRTRFPRVWMAQVRSRVRASATRAAILNES